jgi:hypothetical protein
VLLPASRHAVTLRTASGCEILLHVGIDTVALGGEGFEAHVTRGARVHAGQALLSFDLDFLARRAKSVLTPIIVTAGNTNLNPARTVIEQTVIEQARREAWNGDRAAVMAALGGSSNVRSIAAAASRVRIAVEEAARVDRAALGAFGLRGVAVPAPVACT